MNVAIAEITNFARCQRMGDWGRKSFENDQALDWFFDFERHGAGTVTTAIWAVVNTESDQIDTSAAYHAVAAAEVIAAVHDGNFSNLPTGAEDVLRRYGSKLNRIELISTAARAVERVVDNSELCEAWKETDVFEDWLSEMAKLKSRLSR